MYPLTLAELAEDLEQEKEQHGKQSFDLWRAVCPILLLLTLCRNLTRESKNKSSHLLVKAIKKKHINKSYQVSLVSPASWRGKSLQSWGNILMYKTKYAVLACASGKQQ